MTSTKTKRTSAPCACTNETLCEEAERLYREAHETRDARAFEAHRQRFYSWQDPIRSHDVRIRWDQLHLLDD